MNPLGINLWNWRTGLDEGCVGLPTKVAALGFTAVELPMSAPTLPNGLAQEICSAGLAVSLCAAMAPGRDISNFDPAVRAATMDYQTDCLKAGSKVGATVFSGPLYTGGGKRHWLSESDKAREWDLAVTGLQELARRAGEYGLSLSLEPLSRYRTSVCNTAAQVLRLIEDIGAENVGLHFDTYQAALEEKDLLAALEAALAAGKVNHFHACANNRGAPGQGLIPWEQVLGLLQRYRYAGHITMETFALGGLDSSWVLVHEEPDTLAAIGLAYLNDYFQRHPAV